MPRMAIKPSCDCCLYELSTFGGILLSPPDAAGFVKKLHFCAECYAAIAAALPKPKKRASPKKK